MAPIFGVVPLPALELLEKADQARSAKPAAQRV
jgi:hypothetical protein